MSDSTHYLPSALRDSRGNIWGSESRAQLSKVATPDGAIVFVHGFKVLRDAVGTWNDFPSELPREPRATRYDIFYYGHDSRYSAATNAEELGRFLCALADRPSTTIVNPSLASGRPQRSPSATYKRLIICAHSLGSIVVRLALLSAVDSQDSPLLWRKRVTLVMFAPAHMGASILGIISEALTAFPLMGPVKAALKWKFAALQDLEEKSSTLKELRRDTRRLLDQDALGFDHLRAYVAHGRRDKIVRKNRFVRDRHVPSFPWANHVTVCKPTGRRKQPLTFLLEQLA